MLKVLARCWGFEVSLFHLNAILQGLGRPVRKHELRSMMIPSRDDSTPHQKTENEVQNPTG